jgi:DNA-3-methyladenine glycosylase
MPPRRARAPSPRRLGRADFNRPTLSVARALLGKFLVRDDGGPRSAAMITEVEAYKGPRDRAAHTYGGRRTKRVEPLWREGGTAYVYFVYGMHWMLNVSTAGAEIPEGVLVRAVEDVEHGRHVVGPGRVARHLRIDRALDGADLTTSGELWIEDRGVRIAASRVRTGPRIGVGYAGEYWSARPWRFWVEVEKQRPRS